MPRQLQCDWDPLASEVVRDQRAAYDHMRESCPVAFSELLQWSVFRHADVVRILHDHETFSSVVSTHLAVPSGMDPPEHTTFRRIIEPYFSSEPVEAFEPTCRRIVVGLMERARTAGEIDFMANFAQPFAVEAQCAFLGWPAELHGTLLDWTENNRRATQRQHRDELANLAQQFEDIIDGLLNERRRRAAPPDADLTAALMHERVRDRAIEDAEIASILRNWTVGEVGTIAASIGILVHYLAEHPHLQDQLRDQPSRITPATDEILRIDGPLIANRRVATRQVELGGRECAAGDRISLMWIAANRDGRVFENPDEFRWDRDPAQNLLYGSGIHVCPGAPLARLEMRVILEELLARTTEIRLAADRNSTRAIYPASGFREVHAILR